MVWEPNNQQSKLIFPPSIPSYFSLQGTKRKIIFYLSVGIHSLDKIQFKLTLKSPINVWLSPPNSRFINIRVLPCTSGNDKFACRHIVLSEDSSVFTIYF